MKWLVSSKKCVSAQRHGVREPLILFFMHLMYMKCRLCKVQGRSSQVCRFVDSWAACKDSDSSSWNRAWEPAFWQNSNPCGVFSPCLEALVYTSKATCQFQGIYSSLQPTCPEAECSFRLPTSGFLSPPWYLCIGPVSARHRTDRVDA